MDIVELARQSLERPSDFGYSGDVPIYTTWGRVFGVHRDSDTLERSNFDAFLAALRETDPEEETWTVEHFNHWAFGWADEVFVKVREDDSDDFTPTFARAHELRERLETYPVLDDDAHSALEYEELLEYLENTHGISSDHAPAVAGLMGALPGSGPVRRPRGWQHPTIADDEPDPATVDASVGLYDPHGNLVEVVEGTAAHVGEKTAEYVSRMLADGYPCSVIGEPR